MLLFSYRHEVGCPVCSHSSKIPRQIRDKRPRAAHSLVTTLSSGAERGRAAPKNRHFFLSRPVRGRSSAKKNRIHNSFGHRVLRPTASSQDQRIYVCVTVRGRRNRSAIP